jgi:hypothetical protein
MDNHSHQRQPSKHQTEKHVGAIEPSVPQAVTHCTSHMATPATIHRRSQNITMQHNPKARSTRRQARSELQFVSRIEGLGCYSPLTPGNPMPSGAPAPSLSGAMRASSGGARQQYAKTQAGLRLSWCCIAEPPSYR